MAPGLGRSVISFVGDWGVSQDGELSMLKRGSPGQPATRWSPCEDQISGEKQGSETHSQCAMIDQAAM